MTESKKEIKKIAIAGFGMEGKALYKYFKGNPNVEIHIFDENEIKAPDKKTKVYHGLKIPSDFDIVYKTPGIPTSKIKLENSKKTKISSLTNLFLEKAKGKVVGITGTKGKGTITTLIAHVLKENGFKSVVVGNIGIPAIEQLKNNSENIYYIYEMSSFQCEHLNKSPHIAVLNNIFPDHLNHHKNLKEYKKAKFKITKFQTPEDYFINASDFNVETKAKQIKIKEMATLDCDASPLHSEARNDGFCKAKSVDDELCSSSLRGACDVAIQHIVPSVIASEASQSRNSNSKKFETKLLGEHNQRNCQVAFEVAKILGISEDKIREAIKTYTPLPLRLEKIATKVTKDGRTIKFYDDSLATIPEATLASINALENVNTIILGGSDKGSNLDKFAKEIEKTKIKNFIIFPVTGKEMVKYVKNDPNRKIFEANSMEEAVKFAFANTKGICLMATAAASFGLFKNYKDRSDQYKYWIEKLK